MTRPAGVAEQAVISAKVITERVREPGPQAESGGAQGDVEEAFSELLTKLKGGTERNSQDAAANAPPRSAAPADWREARQRARETWVGEKGGEPEKGTRAAGEDRPASDSDDVDTSLPQAPPKAADPNVAAVAASNADAAVAFAATAAVAASATATESIAAILTLTSAQAPAARAPAISDQPAETSQRTGPAVPSKAVIEATLEAETRVAAPAATLESETRVATPAATLESETRVATPAATLEAETRVAAPAATLESVTTRVAAPAAPTTKGHAAAKDHVRARVPASDLAISSPPDNAKSAAMPSVEVTPVSKDVPKAHVLRQETHFPPVAPATTHGRGAVAPVAGGKLGTGSEAKGNESAALPPIDTGLISTEDPAGGAVPSPSQQIATRITTEISAFEVVDRVQAEPNQVAAKPVLKVLQIQLQPAELGTVSVRIELMNGGLELHVEAAKAETAEIIRGDKETLSNLLRSSGYNVDASSIRVADGDKTAASQQNGQQGAQANMQSSSQSQYGGAERDARAQRGHGGSSGGDTPTQANRTDTHETTTSRASGGLYI